MSKPCLGFSQTRHSTSHSASDSDRSSGSGMPKGYEGLPPAASTSLPTWASI